VRLTQPWWLASENPGLPSWLDLLTPGAVGCAAVTPRARRALGQLYTAFNFARAGTSSLVAEALESGYAAFRSARALVLDLLLSTEHWLRRV
jgi:hypothetical protein